VDDLARGAFLGEVESQCIFALNAWTHFAEALAAFEPVEHRESQARFETACEAFRAIHSFLTHAGCVSRLLWPGPEKRAQSRAAVLRGLVGVSPADAAVLGQRDLRNHLEHYAERLDRWAASAPSRSYIHDVIAPYTPPAWAVERDIMRWYDPATQVYRFQGEIFDVAELHAALKRVLAGAREALRHRDPSREDYGPRAAV
jgi:hypothetical protein